MEDHFKLVMLILFIRIVSSLFLICVSLNNLINYKAPLNLFFIGLGIYSLSHAIKDAKKLF